MTRSAFALLAALSLVGCEDLPAGDKTTPEYWSELYLNLYADKLVVGQLEPGPAELEEPRAVLLITGVTIRAQWFDPIVARLERDGFRPVVYEPPALLSYDLFEASEDLAEVVEQVLADTGQEKIDILAECTGGVIARHYIQSLGGDSKVSRLVTFVSPHHGIDKAPWAAAIAGWPALYDLTPGSKFMKAVNGVPLPPNVPVTSIYTCSDEYIQPYQGSIVPGAKNIGLCDGFVGHFQTFYDPEIYEIMFDALTEPTADELARADAEAQTEAGTGVEVGTEDDAEPETEAPTAPGSEVVSGPIAAPGLPTQQAPQSVSAPGNSGGGPVNDLACNGGGGPGSGAPFVLLALGLLFFQRRRAVRG
jgi:MYXO-CTERM domain-containing protein